MLKRTLYLNSAVTLSLHNMQIELALRDLPDEKRRVPIEDVGCIVIEHSQSIITMPLIAALTENNVAVIFCNNKAQPTSMLLNLDGNNTVSEKFDTQLTASEPLKKQIWQQVIVSKIKNQAAMLDKVCGEGAGALLRPYYNNVLSGDTTNREGISARLYWNKLFGKEFVRQREGMPPNSLLNYGYTLLRAATARALVGSGLLPILGIHHHNRYNAYPLADDIMEPYRPYVDEIAYQIYNKGMVELNKESKIELLRLLTADVVLTDVMRPLSVALTYTAASLVRCFEGEQKRIICPLFQ